MTIADASETQVAFVVESTFGTTPATPPFQLTRITSEDLTGEIQTVVSNELRPDAEVADLIKVGESATGTTPFELSYGTEWDTLFEHALRGTFAGNELKGGVEKKSLTWEKKHETGTPDWYFRYRGSRIGTLNLTFNAQEIVTGTFGILGLDETFDSAEIAGATYAPANTNPVMSAIDVGTITVGGVTEQTFYTQITLDLNNNLRAQNALGSVGAIGIGYGRREITGTMITYFENGDLYEEAVANNAFGLTWPVSDGTNTYTFNLPRCKFTSRTAPAPGNNQDVLAEFGFQALLDPGQATSIIINN